jgi:transposase-like protein
MRRSKYSEEFKKQAIKRVLEGDNSIKEVAESLNMSYDLLKMWRKEYMNKEIKNSSPDNQKKGNALTPLISNAYFIFLSNFLNYFCLKYTQEETYHSILNGA